MPRLRGDYVTIHPYGKVWTIRQYAEAHGKSRERAANLTSAIMKRLGKDYGITHVTRRGQAGFPSKNFVPVGTPWCFGKGWKIEKKKEA